MGYNQMNVEDHSPLLEAQCELCWAGCGGLYDVGRQTGSHNVQRAQAQVELEK